MNKGIFNAVLGVALNILTNTGILCLTTKAFMSNLLYNIVNTNRIWKSRKQFPYIHLYIYTYVRTYVCTGRLTDKCEDLGVCMVLVLWSAACGTLAHSRSTQVQL